MSTDVKVGVRGRPAASAAVLVAIAVASMPKASLADEGGVSFWLTGQFGSLAAVPQQPGWLIGTVFYSHELEREREGGRRTRNHD